MQAREILEDLLKPVDETHDFYKKQQLRELAMLNGILREEGSPMSGSVSPFHNSLGMKRAKTRGTGILSPLVSSRLLPCLEEAWPVILQAAALDAVPMNSDGKGYSRTAAENNIWI
ncbi:hypothetical protein LWI29_020080 [Acer saccharum]|uniref:Uncharacterized protein n=1 Tax=Acer saccharum TaxID=4024 RepID=A0AA39W1I9_ACESA|nr:hypothetical protein LWI29_020080 [Acer saccharum]